ncbi:unnamed protein product [Arabidopsis lyrata]|uniref:Uncharacterized protein n=2 Tax=Arabidopsis lyrata subsp. lyrata TaxID=81972 RepID=D7KB45_ARALL|nr:hypothetical protein ARALYDRAFT_892848 [Arabidopsis lyrata subsp. lyrata]CAH8256672.1 unnamed protein product [Arabidopsis lyrata]
MVCKERELQRRPLNIWRRFYDCLVKLLATQALKKVTLGQPQTLGIVVSNEENSDIGSNIISNVVENMEKNERLSVDGEQVELRVPKEKAPRKIVSIKDEVDEIRISSRRIKRRTSKGSFSSFDEHDVMSLKPLKSILRKDSEVSKYL